MHNPVRTVWSRLDRIIGPMTISVLFGKFGGDLAGYYFADIWGKPQSLWLGFITAACLFVVWPLLERQYDRLTEESE